MVPSSQLNSQGYVDVFAIHCRLNATELSKIMFPDASFITVVRDPVYQFESLYDYYYLEIVYKYSLDDFLNKSLNVRYILWSTFQIKNVS